MESPVIRPLDSSFLADDIFAVSTIEDQDDDDFFMHPSWASSPTDEQPPQEQKAVDLLMEKPLPRKKEVKNDLKGKKEAFAKLPPRAPPAPPAVNSSFWKERCRNLPRPIIFVGSGDPKDDAWKPASTTTLAKKPKVENDLYFVYDVKSPIPKVGQTASSPQKIAQTLGITISMGGLAAKRPRNQKRPFQMHGSFRPQKNPRRIQHGSGDKPFLDSFFVES
eukprot:CAMPEP_0114523846 /NCGR_PEP_ID=MMETSP0109-20121206/21519_1 /TAXON_ID=29199 /ORGANISM="Chlorarachnion reptans, Strain CCCM449" /LENGTH=220 /DNA_ID=CAMNT_0001705209 /DNA_START=50 /DNA_END=712 /DNA_ORIENTATION=+